MSKHTSWQVSGIRAKIGDRRFLTVGPDRDPVTVYVAYSDLTHAEHAASHAEASRIALVWNCHDDLLAALEDLAALTPRKGIPDRWAAALANADAAIAKATGE